MLLSLDAQGILKGIAAQKIMKKTYLISGIVALTILATSAGVISTVMAAGSTSTTGFFGKFMGKQHQVLTDAQKAEMKTKTDAVSAALAAGDYNTWVAAEKAINANSPLLTKVTAANFSAYVQKYKDRETKMTEQKTKMYAVTVALEANGGSGDYNTWVAAEKAINANSPLLTKITADNFSQYVQAHNLQKQIDEIMTKLGIGRENNMSGSGHGIMGDFGQGRHGGTK
jgi:hypothetical protein